VAPLPTRLVALAFVALHAVGVATAAPVADEGTLRNATRVQADDAAADLFERGDASLDDARTADDPRARTAAFDAWLAAFDACEPGRAVPASRPPADAGDLVTPRLFEGRGPALARRVARLVPSERTAWRDHLAPVGDLGLARAGARPGPLADLAARLPGTPAGATALLRLVDLEVAAGRLVRARGWLRRGEEALGLLAGADEHGPVADALGRRAAALAAALATGSRARPTVGSGSLVAAAAARGLEPAGAVLLDDPLGPAPRVRGVDPGTGLFNGACALDDGRWCVQTASRVHLVDPRAARVLGRFEPALLVEEALGAPPFPYPPAEAPGWSFDPVTDGRDLLLVEGRGQGRASASNALVRIAPPPPEQPAAAGSVAQVPLARLVWARSAGGHLDPGGALAPLEALRGAEYQPGPVLVGDRCAVQLRRGTGEVEAALEIVDWRDGRALATVVLGVGRESAGEEPRGVAGRGRSAASPLFADGTRVLAMTNLGLVALVDTLDGTLLWSLRTQRRDGTATRSTRPWTGRRAVALGERWYAAPADSDFLYALPTGPWPDADAGAARRAPIVGPQVAGPGAPLRREDARFLAGPGPRPGTLVCAVRAGARQCLALLDARRASALPGVYLPLGEGLCDGARTLTGGEACLVAVAGERHLYLFDATRELFLVDQDLLVDPRAPRPRGRTPALGGPVFGDGERLGVIGADALLLFRAAAE